ncbi:maleylpyruvate isomerase family mycothiol-dependent enzyme [Kitasatospora sp. NPDC048722]|uniref:maleylpyruvate isomerase family mycothiol-dependent enzyme n=1 Tax=Kitasatospora sp. NPDC048722 TaxID=3155639 RepID=UPI0033F2B752
MEDRTVEGRTVEGRTALLDAVHASAARFAACVSALTETQARGPSALPGWSRAHVVTHVARSADVYTWLLVLARTGTEPGPRADGATLERLLGEGAGRDAPALAADLRASLDRLLDEASAMPAGRWSVLVTALAGWKHPAWYTLHRARRELEVHHTDLALGRTPADWSAGFVAGALEETVAALAECGFPVGRFEAVDLGRAWTVAQTGQTGQTAPAPTASGPGHALLAWLAGRGPAPDPGLPAPPPWPQPPVPGWG